MVQKYLVIFKELYFIFFTKCCDKKSAHNKFDLDIYLELKKIRNKKNIPDFSLTKTKTNQHYRVKKNYLIVVEYYRYHQPLRTF